MLLIHQYSFAMESIISSLIINDEDEQEIEIVMDKNQMYLPCKYILGYFEIPYLQYIWPLANIQVKENT